VAAKKRYHCVAFVHRGKVSGYLSCSTKHERAVAHLTALRDRGMQDVEVVTRSSKPKGVKAPPKGRRRTQGSLFAKEAKGAQGSLFGRRKRR
jgi:hypothetical protein